MITDSDGVPITVVTAKELQAVAPATTPLDRASTLPAGVIVGRDEAMRTFTEVKLVERLLIRSGGAAAAAVLGEGNTVVGVLPREQITEYITSGDYVMPPAHMREGGGGPAPGPGDSTLGGSHQTPAGRIRCRMCGYVNTVPYLDPDNPPECANTAPGRHTLRLI